MSGVHPMIPVPQAIRIVLTETASMMVKDHVRHKYDGHQDVKRHSLIEALPVISGNSESDLVGRISAETIKAPDSGYPTYNASIMDGYAIHLEEVHEVIENSRSKSVQFQVKDRVYAGAIRELRCDTGGDYTKYRPGAVYVTTGAVVPSPYDAVIPIEEVLIDEQNAGSVSIQTSTLISTRRNLWIRPIGCDIKPRAVILNQGQIIETVHLGLLVQCGVHFINVNALPKVGILSTGNELVSHEDIDITAGNTMSEGEIPDANSVLLCSLLSSYQSCNVEALGIVRDDDEAELTRVLKQSIAEYDVIVSSGGISMGEMDIMERVLVEKLECKVHFGRLHMKPGKPTTFLTAKPSDNGEGSERTCLIFALPGNPISAMVCSELLIRPCLDMIHSNRSLNAVDKILPTHDDMYDAVSNMVQNSIVHAEVDAKITSSLKLDTVRPEYHRVTLSLTNGEKGILLEATSTGVQRSSRLMSMCNADGLMALPQGIKGTKTTVDPGESYPVLLTRQSHTNAGVFREVKVKDSRHLRDAPLTLGILEVTGLRAIDLDLDSDQIGNRVQRLMNTPPNGENTMLIESRRTSDLESIQDEVRKMNQCLDVIFIICTEMSFTENIEVSIQLRKLLHKDAPHMSFAIRQAAAYDEPTAALFEPVAGFVNDNNASYVLLSMPDDSLEAVVETMKGSLRQTIYEARC